jgi:HK97 family phage major capsid protein
MERVFGIGPSFRRDKDSGTLTVDMAFASERPYERWWGVEVLKVSGARLGRLNDGDGGPLLFNHNWDELRGRHVPGTVRADSDGVLRGQVEIPSSTQATRDAAALVEARVLTKASVGYQIHRVVEQTTSKSGQRIEREIDGRTFERLLKEHRQVRDGREVGGDRAAFVRALDQVLGQPLERADKELPTYLVMDWEPLENSLVTVPADNAVGVGRAIEAPAAEVRVALSVSATAAPAAPTEKAAMADTPHAAAGANADTLPAQARSVPSALELEQARVRAIDNLCKANKIDTPVRDHWIGTGLSLDQISDDLLRIIEERGRTTSKPASALGLSSREAQRFSLLKAINATRDQNWTQAGFELEASRAIAQRLGKTPDPNRFYVPLEVQQRDITAGTTTAGGFLVGTTNMSFIELMRNRSVVYSMGARRMSGMTGNVTIPRQSGAASAVWLANEASTITESDQVFGQLSLTPKTVGAYTEISRQLMLQSSPDAESLVTSDLATVCALALDVGALRGSGASGQPQGIVGTAGVGSVTGTSLAAAGVLEFQSDVAAGNLMSEACGYVTTPAVAALLMARPELPSTGTTRLWQGNMLEGTLFNMRAMSSNQMLAATMLFGDFSQVVIAEWGVLEVEVNPFANFQAGIVGVRAMVTADVGVRYGGAFSYATSIT